MSIASLFASLKSDHIPEAPVSETETPSLPSCASSRFSSSAAATASVGVPLEPGGDDGRMPVPRDGRAGPRGDDGGDARRSREAVP